MDGFGRTVQTDSGDTQTRSTVLVQYAACGCSPLGKMSKKSQPYANAWGGVHLLHLDILNHVIQVRMPRGANTQYRTFDYNGGTSTVGALLLSATNPETNNLPVRYTYANNRLATKTDANGNQFAYTYDSSGRVTLVTANGNTLRTFYYDTNPFDGSLNSYTTGRLTAIQNATYNVTTPNGATPYYFTEMFGYQQAPAVTTKRLRLIESVTYATGGNPPYNQATVYGNPDATYTLR